ncbi:MAG: hypothetical protein P8123_00795 [bacterium]
MCLIQCVTIALLLCAQPMSQIPNPPTPPTKAEREFAKQFAPESVDAAILDNVDAGRAEELLKALFSRFRMSPRYAIAVYPLPGEKRPRLVFIKGKDADVVLVKKALAAMDEAAKLNAPEAKGPLLMRVDCNEVSASEMRRRLVEAAGRAKLLLDENDFIVYPDGATASLFFIGDPELSDRVTEMSNGLDRSAPPDVLARAKEYARRLGNETAKGFGGLLSTLLSALILILLHLILCHLPFVGRGYRRSFKLFWEKLFASFKGQDLAWEIIKAAAGLGVASSPRPLAGVVKGAGSREIKDHAMRVACEYVRWRGLDSDSPEIQSLLDAAIDAETLKTAIR